MSGLLEEKDLKDLYFSEIAQYDLLTPEREIELATLISKGGKKGKEAREEMINSNLRLVVKIAKDFRHMGLDMSDLINEGNIGLMKAAEKFDVGRNVKFSTYSAYWIRQSIYRALSNKSRTIRLPVHVCSTNSKIIKFISEYKDKNSGRTPSVKQIAKATGSTERLVSDVINGGVTNISSLDQEMNAEEGGTETLGSIIEDRGVAPPSDDWQKIEDEEVLLKLVQKLTNRERYIICHRFGLGKNEPKTLEEIGDHFGVTRERIRQIQKVAMMKLKDYMMKYYRYKPDVPEDYVEGRRTVAKKKREERKRLKRIKLKEKK